MKNTFGLWVFLIGMIFTDFLSLVLLFFAFIMPAQAFSYFIIFKLVMAMLSLLLIISIFGICYFKKWGYYLFIAITILLNLFLGLYLLMVPILSIILIIFLSCFLFHFSKSNVNKLYS